MTDTKRFNLLSDSWIPVRARNGETKTIRAYEIVQQDIVAVAAPRPDFNAALTQFLIGLLQTVYTPENPRAWRSLYAHPPSESELHERFKDITDAFYLNGEGYRFMQDELSVKVGELRPAEELIFGAPGESGKKKNQDHFSKRDSIAGLCRSCVASALLTANIFAEDGGRGYFQSMRGNGFISCLVQLDERESDKTLWKNLWLNVMEGGTKCEPGETFYWLKDFPDKPYIANLERIRSDLNELRRERKRGKDAALGRQIDEKIKSLEIESKTIKKKISGADDADSLTAEKTIFPENNQHVFWAWMRRYYLDTHSVIDAQCGICRNMDRLLVKFYKTGKGYKYPKEEWQNIHPFSPSAKYHRAQYTKENLKYKDKMLALEMTQNGLPYTYWQDFLTQTAERVPSKVVNEHLKRRRTDEQLILWSFGYAMDSNSPKGWYESRTPFYLLNSQERRKEFETEVNRYVQAANRVADSRTGYLVLAIKNAWYDEDKGKNKVQKKTFNKNKASEIGKYFWDNTESKFYDLLDALYEHANDNTLDDEKKVGLRRRWYAAIRRETQDLFDRYAFRSSIQNNPKRIAKAYNQLKTNLVSNSLKIEILALR